MLNLQIKHLTVEQQKCLTELLVNHSDIFTLKPTELGTTKIVSHHIDSGNYSPTHQSLRRTPFLLRKRINEMIEEMLSQGVVQHSQSLWASPIVLVKKKEWRVMILCRLSSIKLSHQVRCIPTPTNRRHVRSVVWSKVFYHP